MLRIKSVRAVVGAIVAVMSARDIPLPATQDIKAYESWQAPPLDE